MNSGAEHENSENLKNRSKLNFGQIVLGKITAIDIENGLCTVQTYDPAEEVVNCVWLTQSFTAPLLGYRIKSLPSIDTNVVLLTGTPSYIISVFDTPDFDESFGLVRTKDGTFLREKHFGDNMYPGYEGSASLLEGEFEIENAFNVGMSFLTNIISLNAGERAKIEAHLLKDMVRIIAEEYRNITPIGEIMSYDDGRPNMEINLGSYVHELLNKRNIDDDKAPISGHTINFPVLDKEDEQDGYHTSFGHRFKTYLGYVGNFLSMFVSDPVTNLNGIASGKAHVHIGNSGDILLRTVSEIALERVVRIAVPAKRDKKLSNLPDYENREFLQKWNYGFGSENTIHQCAYSLRSYARYLSNYASMMRFHQASKSQEGNAPYYIPSEESIPLPDMNNKEQDLIDSNGSMPAFIEGYSTIRIFRDGSILSMDSTGGAVYHGRGFVEISAVKDIKLDAARDISLIAGRNMFFKAKKNIEMSSTEGGFVLKAYSLLNMLCTFGKVWIKSDSEGKETSDNKNPEAYGIFLDASRNSVLINSRDNTILNQEESNLFINSEKGSVLINSNKDVLIKGKQGNLYIDVMGNIISKAVNVFFNVTKFNVSNLFTLTNSNFILKTKAFLTNQLFVRSDIFSRPHETRQRPIIRCCDAEGTTSGYIPGDYNHVKKVTGQKFPTTDTDNISSLNLAFNNLNSTLSKKVLSYKSSLWKFQRESVPPADGSKDALFIPHAQDFIETNPSDFSDYDTWDFHEDDKLEAAPRTLEGSLPYPFDKEAKENYSDFAAGEILNKPSKYPAYVWEQPQIKSRVIKRKVKK